MCQNIYTCSDHSQAQQLSGPITSVEKLQHSDHTVVVFVDASGMPNGFAKVGLKDLFFYKNGKAVEYPRSPCLLDFFVAEDLQRRGIGLLLFRKALDVNKHSTCSCVLVLRASVRLTLFFLFTVCCMYKGAGCGRSLQRCLRQALSEAPGIPVQALRLEAW